MDKLKMIAYHEAGHALMNSYLGNTVKATIIPDDDSDGHCELIGKDALDVSYINGSWDLTNKHHKQHRIKVWRIICIYVAGFTAERILDNDTKLWSCGHEDMETAYEAINWINKDDLSLVPKEDKYFGVACRKVERFLREHWEEVENIAEALLDAKTTVIKKRTVKK
jgi:hypothetical protein